VFVTLKEMASSVEIDGGGERTYEKLLEEISVYGLFQEILSLALVFYFLVKVASGNLYMLSSDIPFVAGGHDQRTALAEKVRGRHMKEIQNSAQETKSNAPPIDIIRSVNVAGL
jgi:hypothetical protein